jgi:hypothetical protein
LKILFICKKNNTYGFIAKTKRSSGLYNSTRFIVHALNETGIHAKIVEVTDGNDIDREVHQFKPNIVVIEAIWPTPEKMIELVGLHKKVEWFCHLHSNMPFLAMEGMAMDWILKYAKSGVRLIANSHASYRALLAIVKHPELIYLPNVYLGHPHAPKIHDQRRGAINVGCFGAVRPLKNHLIQALAAVRFANEHKLHLNFFINGTRIETGGEPVMKNLRQLFSHLPHWLHEVHWCEPEEFIELLHHRIDIGMQVSLTETFSVVSADYTTAGIPMVISKEIIWGHPKCRAQDDSIDSIVEAMNRVWQSKCLIKKNQKLLAAHAKKAALQWERFVRAELT